MTCLPFRHSNIPEIVPFLLQVVLKGALPPLLGDDRVLLVPLAMTAIMILFIDLGADIIPAIAFAYELGEADIMKHPPRNRSVDKLVTWQLISWSYLQIGIIQVLSQFPLT